MGFIPDAAAERSRAQNEKRSLITAACLDDIEKAHWPKLQSFLQRVADEDQEILSIGIRTRLGSVKVLTSHHADYWDAASNAGPDQYESVEPLKIQIQQRNQLWGNMEFALTKTNQTYFGGLLSHPLTQLVGFFSIFGLSAYTLFVARVFGVFNSTQVVPERVRSALDTLAEGLLLLDESGTIVFANQAFGNAILRKPQDLEGKKACDLSWVRSGDNDAEAHPWMMAVNDSQIVTGCVIRMQINESQQRIFSVNAAPLGKDKQGRGALVTFRDVTHEEEHRAELEEMLRLLGDSRDEIERKNTELEILAKQDSLTGCMNRRAFFAEFEVQWKLSNVQSTPLSTIMIDVDHFKSVNDTYGHHTGDEVLRAVSKTVREQFRHLGLVCRYGGEEFCILLPGKTLQQAAEIAEQTRLAIMEIRLVEPAELRLAASIGVSERRFEAAEPQELVNQADACLYVAKREGRNRVITFNASMVVEESEESQEKKVVDKHPKINLSFQAVTALVSALSYRDARTAEHSRRVADLCSRMADGFLNPVAKYVLEIAALLHDIGKIGVPDKILNKPGPLTNDEWEIMGRHDHIGFEIVQGALDCAELSEIVCNHHAFYGGKGRHTDLPMGNDIPIGARILTIADSYDAMTSDRVYRKGMSHEDAVKELRRCSGTQFDPELVEMFVQRMSTTSTEVFGGLALGQQVTLKIGSCVEGLVNALDQSDVETIKHRLEVLQAYASETELNSISEAAQLLANDLDNESTELRDIVRQTLDLLDACRATQRVFLKNNLFRLVEEQN
jgi:diguanylate cyclase (GGDEF)-like protein/putative nucleotidyltransferase with HDIG domain